FLDAFAEAGADTITVHPEAGPHLHRTIQRVRALGKKAGVSLNPATPAKALDYVLGEIDLGIDAETAPQAVNAGASVLVAGTAAFRGGATAYAGNIRALRGE